MQKLFQGIASFQRTVFRQRQAFFERLAEGQSPLALFITCSDSRIAPNLLTQTEPGELFVLRTAGNIVPPYGAAQGGEAGTIEYAVAVLKIGHIIVCGHSHCGAMSGLLHPERIQHLHAVRALLQHAEATRQIVLENYPELTDEGERLAKAVEQNVLVQLENLRTHPAVAAGLARGDLKLHGWVYQIETGQVSAYDSEVNQFVPIQATTTSLLG